MVVSTTPMCLKGKLTRSCRLITSLTLLANLSKGFCANQDIYRNQIQFYVDVESICNCFTYCLCKFCKDYQLNVKELTKLPQIFWELIDLVCPKFFGLNLSITCKEQLTHVSYGLATITHCVARLRLPCLCLVQR